MSQSRGHAPLVPIVVSSLVDNTVVLEKVNVSPEDLIPDTQLYGSLNYYDRTTSRAERKKIWGNDYHLVCTGKSNVEILERSGANARLQPSVQELADRYIKRS